MKRCELYFRNPLPRSFYLKSTPDVAKSLLGKALIVRKPRTELLAVLITEVEAYLQKDPASHSFVGRTKRNGAMFGRGGTCYVYISYGIHYCMNVVTGPEGMGEAVLIRAAVPFTGLKTLLRNRRKKCDKTLLNGPGKLTQALGIDLNYNGEEFGCGKIDLVSVGFAPSEIHCSRRIGISKGVELPLRFFITEPPKAHRGA